MRAGNTVHNQVGYDHPVPLKNGSTIWLAKPLSQIESGILEFFMNKDYVIGPPPRNVTTEGGFCVRKLGCREDWHLRIVDSKICAMAPCVAQTANIPIEEPNCIERLYAHIRKHSRNTDKLRGGTKQIIWVS